MSLEAYSDYDGVAKPHVEAVTFKIYNDTESAYADVVDNKLDVTDQIPTSALSDAGFKAELDGRWVASPRGAIQVLTFPSDDADDSYNRTKVRRAISMAIDRSDIVDEVFDGAVVAAEGWVPPGVTGYKSDRCGEACSHDAKKAKTLLREGGGHRSRMTISYSLDSEKQAWIEVCKDIEDALDVTCEVKDVADAKFRDLVAGEDMEGMYSQQWSMDYPSIDNFLVPT